MLILRDCMSSPIISVDRDSTILDSVKVMVKNDVESILIKDKEDYIGIFTTSDLMSRVIIKELDMKTTKIETVISSPILTVDFCLSPREANEIMLKHKIKRLGVTEGKKIVGIISTKDIIAL